MIPISGLTLLVATGSAATMFLFGTVRKKRQDTLPQKNGRRSYTAWERSRHTGKNRLR